MATLGPKCGRCQTHVDTVSFHCYCGDLAEFTCCSTFAWRSIGKYSNPPTCGYCRQPMIERGFRHGTEEAESGYSLEAQAMGYAEAFDRWVRWVLEPHPEPLDLDEAQQRRLKHYDALLTVLAT